jgi:hypothetical protein
MVSSTSGAVEIERVPALAVVTAVRRVGLVDDAGVDADGEGLVVSGHVELAAAESALLTRYWWC